MSSLKVIADRQDDNSVKFAVFVPPRANGEVNFGAVEAVNRGLLLVKPDAFDPPSVPAAQLAHNDGHTADGGGVIPADLAAAMLRDGVIEFSPEEPPLRACPAGGCGED